MFARIALGVAIAVAMGGSALAATDSATSRDVSAQRRAAITIYPRHELVGPNATRHCDSWLARENRPSGPVVVPKMRCYWR